jgi:hypothetical protein
MIDKEAAGRGFWVVCREIKASVDDGLLVGLSGTSAWSPCPLLPSNGANKWGIFVSKLDISTTASTFTYLCPLNNENVPSYLHHPPMPPRENPIGYILLWTKILIFSSSFINIFE